jgi:TIR domain
MGVFISWSGKNTKSYMVADALRRWLEQVIQGCNPWMSSQDIDAGQRWATELFAQLDNLSVGIMCVTKANQGEPSLNFEAGALAKQLKGDKPDETRVCPLLIDMTENDVTGPLKLLQMVLFGRRRRV